MSVDTTKLTFGYRLVTQTLDDGRVVPGIESCGYDFSSFDKHDLSFEVHGSFWDGFIDMFKGTFEGKIVDAIKGIVEKELTQTLPADFNKMIAKTDGFGHIKSMPEWWLDFSEQEAGQVTDTSVELGVRGIFFDHLFNETLPTFPVMQYKDPAIPSALQAFVSQQSVNSALSSFLQVHPIEGFFNATDLPAGSKVNLTTGFLEKAFKGISDYYGPDCPVDVKYSLTNVYDFAVTKDFPNLALYADADLKFYVETANGTELAVDLAVSKFEFDGSIEIVEGYNISANITKLKVHNVKVNSCSFGKIGTFKLQMGLNVALAVLAPKIAAKLMTIEVPKSLLGYFDLSDMVIAYYDQYFGIGATPTFIPPPLPAPPAGTTYASRVCVRNKAGFVLKWQFKDKHTKETSDYTEHYPIDQTKCMDIDDALPYVQEGVMIQTIVDASAGKTNHVDHLVVYTGKEVNTVQFTCRGTTLDYSCTEDNYNPEEAALENLLDLIGSFF